MQYNKSYTLPPTISPVKMTSESRQTVFKIPYAFSVKKIISRLIKYGTFQHQIRYSVKIFLNDFKSVILQYYLQRLIGGE